MSPKSLANDSTSGCNVIPKWLAAIAQKRIHVIPRVIPLTFSRVPRKIPIAITSANTKTECATLVPKNKLLNQSI